MNRTLIAIASLAVLVAACGRVGADTPTSTPPTTAPPTTTPHTTATTPAPTWTPTRTPCAEPGEFVTDCDLPGYRDRPYDLAVPSTSTPDRAAPLVVVLHGGGGNSENAATGPCGGGDLADASCWHSIGETEGFITAYPNGSSARLLPDIRTWNAGGGVDGYNCASGRACERNVDDVAYLHALLDELEATLHIDTTRVYVTGLSNGGAMAHRVACEMADRVTAVAPVGGANQFTTAAECAPSEPVAVMQIHGTEDPCWTYEESGAACLDEDGELKVGVEDSTNAWVARLGCDPASTASAVPDTTDDGTTTTRIAWSGCDTGAAVVLMRIDGGGHAWPGGDQYFGTRFIGIAPQDWDTTLIWEFFAQFER